MRSADTVLGLIRERGKRGLPLERVYKLLFNPELGAIERRMPSSGRGRRKRARSGTSPAAYFTRQPGSAGGRRKRGTALA